MTTASKLLDRSISAEWDRAPRHPGRARVWLSLDYRPMLPANSGRNDLFTGPMQLGPENRISSRSSSRTQRYPASMTGMAGSLST
jgi:hypothetical protein